MAIKQRHRTNSFTRGLRGGIHILALVLAVGLLLFQLFSSIAFAVSESTWVGMRSIAAALFPVSVAVYFAFLARLNLPTNRSRAPIINNYIFFVLWTLLVLSIDGSVQLTSFPLEELLYSLTIAALIWRYKRQDSVKDLLACCYGILSGSLASVILFGWNPATM
jgi:hypothetical protein